MISASVAWCRPSRSLRRTMRAAGSSRSSRSRAASSSSRPSGSAAIRKSSPPRSKRPNRSKDHLMLALNNIEVVYDGVILVLKGVSLNAEEGHITTLLGANGAGKTTTLKAISALLHTERGEVTKGRVDLAGERLDRPPTAAVVKGR